jgi:hypothetical protein
MARPDRLLWAYAHHADHRLRHRCLRRRGAGARRAQALPSDQGRWQAPQTLRPPRSNLLERAGEAGPEPTGRRYGVGHHLDARSAFASQRSGEKLERFGIDSEQGFLLRRVQLIFRQNFRLNIEQFPKTGINVHGSTVHSYGCACELPTPREDRARLGMSELEVEHFDIYLYRVHECKHRPVQPHPIQGHPGCGKYTGELSDSSLALDEAIIVDRPQPGGLIPAALKAFTVDRDHYRVRAVSEGPAVLLLPIEFSRCFRVTSRSTGVLPESFRADLLLAGILFDHDLDAEILLSFRSVQQFTMPP